MKLKTLYSKRSDGKVQIWEKEIDGNKHRSISGIKDGKIVISKWSTCKPKNKGKSNETSGETQCLKDAKAEWQKKVDKGYKEEIEDVDEQTFFEPMLAKKWQDYKDEIKYPVYVQPKLDGLRLIAKKDGLWTRNGKEYKSIPHIYKALEPLFKKDPTLIFDGEVYADKFSNDFNQICSLAKRTKPTKDELKESEKSIEYWIYDFPSCKDIFNARYTELTDIMSKFDMEDSGCVKVLNTYIAYQEKRSYRFLRTVY